MYPQFFTIIFTNRQQPNTANSYQITLVLLALAVSLSPGRTTLNRNDSHPEKKIQFQVWGLLHVPQQAGLGSLSVPANCCSTFRAACIRGRSNYFSKSCKRKSLVTSLHLRAERNKKWLTLVGNQMAQKQSALKVWWNSLPTKSRMTDEMSTDDCFLCCTRRNSHEYFLSWVHWVRCFTNDKTSGRCRGTSVLPVDHLASWKERHLSCFWLPCAWKIGEWNRIDKGACRSHFGGLRRSWPACVLCFVESTLTGQVVWATRQKEVLCVSLGTVL